MYIQSSIWNRNFYNEIQIAKQNNKSKNNKPGNWKIFSNKVC